MMLMISIIFFVIFLYSYKYMEEDPHIIRFLVYILIFVTFMFILVSSGNIIQLFIG